MSDVEKKYCTVKGKRVFYRERAALSDASPPVLLVHGNVAGSLWFDRAMEIGSSRVLAPDLPNFGRSEHIDVSDIDVYAEYAGELAEEVLGHRPFVLVGHSLGGAVAMALAKRMPERIAGLVLVDSCPPDGLVTPEEHYPIIEQYKSDRALLKQALASLTPRLSNDAVLESLVDLALQMNPDSFAGNARALARFDFTPDAAALAIPVLVIRGSEDYLITAEMAERTAAAFPDGSLTTVANIGHALPVEDPSAFEELIARFASQF